MSDRDYARMTAREIREQCRSGEFDRPTAGAANGFVQANLVILGQRDAVDFERFCGLNPKPCPLLEVTSPGVYEPTKSAPGADLRTDLPRYRVFKNGECVARPQSIEPYWDETCVAFLIGCSFTFEKALVEAGIPVRHLEQNCNVPMYRTNIACASAGAFSGPMVVSMRPMMPVQAQQAQRITAAHPLSHGAPLQVGDPAAIGITALDRPDYGDPVTIRDGEIPVFWACGVTPLEAIRNATPDLGIVHEPGHMFITDLHEDAT